MRKPPTKTKIATLQNTNTRSHQNQQRKVISKLTTKTLFDLVAQARNPLETEILNSGLDAMSSNELTVFFSFTDGSKRATVVHCSGKNLAEVWKKLASWQQKTYKKSPQARWLRVDWVTEKRLTSWADCLHQIQSVKRNYFRYGIALDTNFRYAFLEQELNANAMLYLGGSHSKAGLNKNNFLRYAVKRYGKHFSLPSSTQDPVMLFTTKAILVQPGKECEILYGYSGGKEGRNTGRRIINKLTPPTVKSLVQQASQFLAEQVDATGRFIYGLHPCFDREIKAYNTLRHTSTTYAMLEAWEVTQSPELKAAIDRSINHLTQDLIRQYKLPCGTAVAYLQDDNNEIKLGGSAVCLLALVKYTELTTDRHFLTLLEQLALGIEHMQNKENGQFTHVLHADDLSVKQTFRIIYYDGEAAFGLMRLYGLTKDPRWLQMVEKAFVYFIAQQHWKNHDHWLSYCVNELTLYRPEERYFQFGIQNVAGYLDFVIGRITTYPTLLELMMAAHKMIVRLKASNQHRHLLKQINLEKFYRALETRAHYLLNGFFWPEFAIYFQNPQRIMGSFFIRHHSFRVRIDDVEHYLSGYVAYLQHYLLRPSPKGAPSGILCADDSVDNESEPPHQPQLNHLPADAVLAWGGDVNLGRRQHYRTQQLGVENILNIPELKHADLSVVNLECVVSTLGEQGINKGEGGPYYYRARPEMLRILTMANIKAVTVANNHSGDYGAGALMQQQELLQALGIACAGSGKNHREAFAPALCQAGELRVAIFSVDTTQPRFAATDEQPGSAYLPLQEVASWLHTFTPLINQARKNADLVMVAIHWGENFAEQPDSDQISIGHLLIDAGADAILGASAHCLQGIEIYHNKPIIHDAGNLLFDSVSNRLSDSGIFRLGLSKQGVCWVEFIPVGSGFGFSQRLYGHRAQALIERYQTRCQQLGTVLHPQGDRAFIELTATSAAPAKSVPQIPSYQLDVLTNFEPKAEQGQVDDVPADAVITPVELNGLTLLGVRITPNDIKRRQMLWIETWWTCAQPSSEDLRIHLTASPLGGSKMPSWGQGMDHDPCDWMQPSSRWQPHKIYRDHYGLRPPKMSQLENCRLQLEIRVIGTKQNYDSYLHPQTISIAISGLVTNPLSRDYRTDFSDLDLQVPKGQTWTAEQLEQITGGNWLVEPPKGWFVRSVVNGESFIAMRKAPTLFVAHTNHDRAFHEQYSTPPKSLQDRHKNLPDIANRIAGALVTRPVSGLPDGLPVLQVKDPIRAIMELGFAARQRFQGPVIAVTGTTGKSSTIGLIETLFTAGQSIKSVANYNSRVGAPVQLASLAPAHEAALLEIAQSALWMKRGPITRQIKPNIAVITEIGVSQVALRVKDTQDTAKWKSRIFDGLAPDGIAVIGEHLTHFDFIYRAASQHAAKIVTFGSSPKATLQIQTQETISNSTHLTIQLEGRIHRLDIPFINKGMIRNALATLAIAHALNLSLEKAAAGLINYQPEDGRLVNYRCQLNGNTIHIIDDSWNAEVSSMLNAFDELKQRQITGRKIAVLGRIVHLGNQAEALHESLAEPLLASNIDYVLTHGEEMKFLRKMLPDRLLGQHFSSANDLFAELSRQVQPNDLVLLKGSRRNSDFGKISRLCLAHKLN